MKTIWKFPIVDTGRVRLTMPRDAEVLSLQVQYGTPTLWALVDPRNPVVERTFRVFGTGFSMPDELGKFVGSFQLDDGQLVFHLFEEL